MRVVIRAGVVSGRKCVWLLDDEQTAFRVEVHSVGLHGWSRSRGENSNESRGSWRGGGDLNSGFRRRLARAAAAKNITAA